jgi:alpha,alpha-trehalase
MDVRITSKSPATVGTLKPLLKNEQPVETTLADSGPTESVILGQSGPLLKLKASPVAQEPIAGPPAGGLAHGRQTETCSGTAGHIAPSMPVAFDLSVPGLIMGDSTPWQKVWTEQPKAGAHGVVQVPFAFPGDQDGKLELRDADLHYRGLMALGATDAAHGTLENWLDLGNRYSALPGRNRLNELGRSALPRLTGVLLEEAERTQDVGFLKDAYEVVAQDYKQSWSDRYFKATPNGLNRFCDVDYSHDATLEEAGGELQAARFGGNPMPFNPIDLNAHLYATERDLGSMADKLADSSQSAEQSARLRQEAQVWRDKAAQRKELILGSLWDQESGIFRDLNFQENKPSQVQSLAAFSVLSAGLLDAGQEKEKKILDKLVGSLDRFADGETFRWDSESDRTAPPVELLRLRDGLRAYGYEQQAKRVEGAARSALSKGGPQGTLDLCAAALLEQHPKGPSSHSISLSPLGQQRLAGMGRALGLPQLGLDSQKRREIDKALRGFDSSLLDSKVLQSLFERRLGATVLGLEVANGSLRLATPPQPPAVSIPGDGIKLDKLTLDTGLPQVKAGALGDGALLLERNGAKLAVVELGDQVVIGDKVYPAEILAQAGNSLPGLLTSFHTAGGNPRLEAFLHANRDWVSVPATAGSSVAQLKARPGWNRLMDKTAAGWKPLTIPPSVVAHDTATQYFNPAAVPSVGIFKTQFNWDTEFMAMGMQNQGQNALVSDMTDNLLYLLKSTGRVPNAARSVYLNKAQPPFLPDLVRRSTVEREQRFGKSSTEAWKAEAYSLMSKDFHLFWREPEGRAVPDIGGKPRHLSRWGGDNHKFAMDESGYDTTSRFDGKTKDLVPPDLNAFLYKYAKDMAAIASDLAQAAQGRGDTSGLLKYTSEAAHWNEEAGSIKKDLLELCWDEQDGMFRDYRFQGEPQGLAKDFDALSAVAAPVWAGVLDPADPKEARMLERCLDNLSSRFEKEHGLAASAEDYGHPEMQWNGPSGWAPLTMMAVQAEKRYGRPEAAARHTAKWLDTLAGVHDKDGIILERYDVVEGGHPPVQKGRYEETQGEGPGFGWTNASVPWAMVEIFAGASVVRPPGQPPRLQIQPCLPECLQGEKLETSYEIPGTDQRCKFSHRLDPGSGAYAFTFEGQLDRIPQLELVTPPMAPGMLPIASEGLPPFSIETTRQGGKEIHRVRFDRPAGQSAFSLSFAPGV